MSFAFDALADGADAFGFGSYGETFVAQSDLPEEPPEDEILAPCQRILQLQSKLDKFAVDKPVLGKMLVHNVGLAVEQFDIGVGSLHWEECAVVWSGQLYKPDNLADEIDFAGGPTVPCLLVFPVGCITSSGLKQVDDSDTVLHLTLKHTIPVHLAARGQEQSFRTLLERVQREMQQQTTPVANEIVHDQAWAHIRKEKARQTRDEAIRVAKEEYARTMCAIEREIAEATRELCLLCCDGTVTMRMLAWRNCYRAVMECVRRACRS